MSAFPPSDASTGRSDPNAALPPELPLFRFGLRQLFAFVAVLCTLLTGMVIAQGVTALVLLLAALVVAAHVTSTALGSRLRARADRQIVAGLLVAGPRSPSPAIVLPAKRPYWHSHGRTTLGWLPMLVVLGIAVGGVGGGIFLAIVIGHRTSIPGLVVGAVSLAVLGGWFAFLGSSFYAIFRHGLREAIVEQTKDESRRAARVNDEIRMSNDE